MRTIETGTADTHRGRYTAAIGIIVAAGAMLRLYGGMGELWLDELHSLVQVAPLTGPSQLFTEFLSDNNHLLNSLWLWLLGKGRGALVYRLPAIICGILTLPLVWVIGRRRSQTAGLLTLALFAFSYLFVLYGSEARGYGPMILALAAATALLIDPRIMRSPARLAAFNAIAVFGVLAHFSFSLFFFGAVPYAVRHYRLKGTVLLFIFPFTFVALLYQAYIRYLPEGTGTLRSYWDVFFTALSLFAGGPVMTAANEHQTIASFQIAALSFAFLAVSLLWAWQRHDGRRELFAGIILIAPLFVFFILTPRVLFPRYFLVPIFFMLLLAADTLAILVEKRRTALVLVVPLVLAYLFGQGNHLRRLLTVHRGGFHAAAQLLAEGTTEEPIRAGANQHYRVGLPLRFYLESLSPSRSLDLQADDLPSPDVQWYLVQDDDRAAVHPSLLGAGSEQFELVKHFPATEESGLDLWVYRRRNG